MQARWKGWAQQMKVLTVNADGTYCQETRALLENAEGITVLQEQAGPGMVSPFSDLRPDVVLLDLDTAACDAAGLVTRLGEQHPGAKILVLSSPGHEEAVLRALRRGAWGHLIKGTYNRADLVAALRAVFRGDSILTPAMAGVILDEINYRHQLVRNALPVTDHKEPKGADLPSSQDRPSE